MTEKRQTSQGYIIRILQHFATKLRNITNFVMLFQAVMTVNYDISLAGKERLNFIPESTARSAVPGESQGRGYTNSARLFTHGERK